MDDDDDDGRVHERRSKSMLVRTPSAGQRRLRAELEEKEEQLQFAAEMGPLQPGHLIKASAVRACRARTL